MTFIEGLFLRRPAPSIGHRAPEPACDLADSRGWSQPSYATVYRIATRLDPALVTIAQDGDKVYTEAFDLMYRREATRPNAMWQADHTELKGERHRT